MRSAFVKSIAEVMETNSKVVLLIADIGAYLLRDVKSRFPERFINVGIAEANMINMAVGLSMDGWIPFVYTITPFVTSRSYDQIRVGVGYNGGDVKIVGIGSGISYAGLGGTHHSIEDIAIMRAIPGMTIVSPSDGVETGEAVRAVAFHQGPVYLRLMLNAPALDIVYEKPFAIGKSRVVRGPAESEITILVTGELLGEVLLVSDMLTNEGIGVRVVNVSTIKPLDLDVVRQALESKYIFTVEEHSVIGGLGSAIAEALFDINKTWKMPMLTRIGINDQIVRKYGHKHELYSYLGLDSEGIHKQIKKIYAGPLENIN